MSPLAHAAGRGRTAGTPLPRRRSRRARTRLALLAVGLSGLLGLATACTPDTPPTPATCSMPVPAPTLAPGSLTLPPDPKVLVFGDSYTEGYGAEPETKGWAYLVGKPLGWTVTVDGVGGTGYVNPGPRNQGTYLQRLPALQGRTFDLVVVQGGSNDRDTPYPALKAAVDTTLEAVRAQFPGARLALMGPATPYGKPDAVRTLSQCILAGYASTHQLPFIDPLGEQWFVDGDGDRYANPANGHPSNAGYRVMAARFEGDATVLLGRS